MYLGGQHTQPMVDISNIGRVIRLQVTKFSVLPQLEIDYLHKSSTGVTTGARNSIKRAEMEFTIVLGVRLLPTFVQYLLSAYFRPCRNDHILYCYSLYNIALSMWRAMVGRISRQRK